MSFLDGERFPAHLECRTLDASAASSYQAQMNGKRGQNFPVAASGYGISGTGYGTSAFSGEMKVDPEALAAYDQVGSKMVERAFALIGKLNEPT
jgi:hypothetical protein